MRRICKWIIGISFIFIVFAFVNLKDGTAKRIQHLEATKWDRARDHCQGYESYNDGRYARCFDAELKKGAY